jgi:UDP-glucose:(heptosyl)LPS alpha-1,3-glucosyltransferase
MQLAFVLYKYFPFGGLQRDFMRIALECQQRGHQIRVYTMIWEGDIPPGFEVLVAPVKAFFNHGATKK